MRLPDLLDRGVLPGVDRELLVGVSGGVDSVVLAHALVAAGFPLTLVHVHHGLRGASADADLELVRELAGEIGAAFESVAVTVPRLAGTSVQEVARQERYGAMARVAQRRHIVHVAVGHHAGDQVETVLMNLGRGAGPAGLAGMRARGPYPGARELVLLRPLLGVGRAEIESVARQAGLRWREDPTNLRADYRRNAVRLELLPELRKALGKGVEAGILRTAGLMTSLEDAAVEPVAAVLLDSLARPLDGRHVQVNGAMLPDGALEQLPGFWRGRVLLDAAATFLPGSPRNQSHAQALAALLESQPGRWVASGPGRVWRERGGLAFVAAVESPGEVMVEPGGHAHYGRYRIDFSDAAKRAPAAWVRDGKALLVRPWKPGDRVRTEAGTRKIKDLLTEAGVPCFSRNSAPVAVQEECVTWVPGFVVASQTSEHLRPVALSVE